MIPRQRTVGTTAALLSLIYSHPSSLRKPGHCQAQTKVIYHSTPPPPHKLSNKGFYNTVAAIDLALYGTISFLDFIFSIILPPPFDMMNQA
ncbi:hypothetical protein L2E82_50144 [Cichorium intybus]|nr:hypothetical protein L2E82_50144 [Cichorium intybus]